MTTSAQPVPGPILVGSYRLLAPIGEGGMGVVHLAQGPDGSRVALKVLRPHIVGDTEARERLAREVSSLMRIKSPRIAEIIDADPHGPVPFVVTRYVPGLSLHHHVAQEGVLAGADLLHFADALAEALHAVHAVGVLHRDIKPTNVLMEGRSPVLIDFGLARVAEDPRLTQSGWLLGTPGYLAPEILYGDDASPASDVHAWAATVAYAATGRPPYGTGPSMAIMDRVRRGEFQLGGVPEPLVRVLRDCLSAEPLSRPSVTELRAWIHQLRVLPETVQQPGSKPAPAPEPWTMPYRPTLPAAPQTRILPATSPGSVGPSTTPAWVAPRPESRAQRVLQLLGLGTVTTTLVAFAPIAGVALVASVVLGLRTASVTRQRHGRRRMIRGRARWYDVPTTAISLPGYLVLALFGTLMLIGAASLTGAAMFSFGYLLGQPVAVGLLMAGLGFTPALWWGPGSGRVREVARSLVARTARTELGGWFVLAMCLVGSTLLVGVLLSTGPNWAPATEVPWRP